MPIKDNWDKYVDNVLASAQEKRDKIINEINAEKFETIEKADNEILRLIYLDIQSQMLEIKNQSQRMLSQKALEFKKELFLRRNEITDTILNKLKEKVLAFKNSEDYKSYLLKQLKKAEDILSTNDIVLEILQKDEDIIKEILKNQNLSYEIVISEFIKTGGFIAKAKGKNTKIDLTLDTKIEEQRGYFEQISNLTII